MVLIGFLIFLETSWPKLAQTNEPSATLLLSLFSLALWKNEISPWYFPEDNVQGLCRKGRQWTVQIQTVPASSFPCPGLRYSKILPLSWRHRTPLPRQRQQESSLNEKHVHWTGSRVHAMRAWLMVVSFSRTFRFLSSALLEKTKEETSRQLAIRIQEFQLQPTDTEEFKPERSLSSFICQVEPVLRLTR